MHRMPPPRKLHRQTLPLRSPQKRILRHRNRAPERHLRQSLKRLLQSARRITVRCTHNCHEPQDQHDRYGVRGGGVQDL